MSDDDGSVERGVENVVRACLQVVPGERVALMTHDADDVARLFTVALERARTRVIRVPLEPWAGRTTTTTTPGIAASITGCSASMVLARNLPGPVSLAALQAARRIGTRHLHAIGVERRLLGQSFRADPERLAALNQEMRALVQRGSEITVKSAAGTHLRVGTAPAFPILALDGRPTKVAFDNLPAGFLLLHPASVEGVFVADRALVSAAFGAEPSLVRRVAPQFHVARGRVEKVVCGDPGLEERIQAYLESHVHAPRVGTVWIPTNYLVRTEIGVGPQDALLPGLVLSLGFSASERTRAPWDAPVQLRLLGRKHTLEVGGRTPVRDGRFEAWFADGLDPLR